MDNWRLNHLQELLNEDPKDEFVLYALAQEYTKLEDLDQALVHYIRLKKVNADYVGMYYHLAALYLELEKEEEALATYVEGIDIAQRLGDHHALSELKNAKTNFELGL